jgi:hypothetical protein
VRDLGELFSHPPEGALHHYTSIDAVLGIAQTKVLWASNAYYLNDSSEIIEAINFVRRVAEKVSHKLPADESELLRQLHAWLPRLERPHGIFVVSLSERWNDLKQWNSYTPFGKGVCLSFYPESVRDIAANAKFRFAKCVYAKEEKEQRAKLVIEKTIESWRNGFDTTKNGPKDQTFYPMFERLKGQFLSVFATLKHKAFKQEREWRLISEYIPSDTDKRLSFRAGSSLLVPYIQVSLQSRTTLIDEITLGPTEHINLSMSAMGSLKSRYGLANVLRSSTIPYREWR